VHSLGFSVGGPPRYWVTGDPRAVWPREADFRRWLAASPGLVADCLEVPRIALTGQEVPIGEQVASFDILGRGPAYVEQSGDIGDVIVPAIVHAAYLAVLGGLEAGLLAAELPVLAGDVHTFTGALADEVSLKLRDYGEEDDRVSGTGRPP
jgi:hypothetical protein